MRCSGMPRPTWMSGEVTSMPSLIRSGRPSASFASSAPAGRTCTALRVSSAMPMSLRRFHVRGGHLGRRAAPEQRQRVLRLLAQDLEHLLDALRAAEGEPVERGTTDEHGARAERERHHDVGTAPHTAVEIHLPAIANGLNY